MNNNCVGCAQPCCFANVPENGPADCIHQPFDEKEYLQELVFSLFDQACNIEGIYNHDCISCYEEAQRYLISIGKINKVDCKFES
jgi:hypothetical protein